MIPLKGLDKHSETVPLFAPECQFSNQHGYSTA